MTKLRLLRVQYINQWQLDTSSLNSIFPAEQALIEKIKGSSDDYFHSVKLAYSDDDKYHYYLNFLIESLELLPLKVDLAFDNCWKGFESLIFEQNPTWKKAHEVLSTFAVGYENKECKSYHDGAALISKLLELIPVQTCEYLSQKLLKSYPGSDAKLITDRLQWKNNNSRFLTLLPEIAQKYNAPNVLQGDFRKAALLIKKIFKGDSIQVGSFEGSFSLTERFSLLLLGVLYTFRNDRFHGNMQPPFKSSVATLQTYAHAHFCFLATFHLFIQILQQTGWASFNFDGTSETLSKNLNNFEHLYGKHLEH